jgi:hypothetical protein
VFAADRIDTWVLRVSIAIPVACLAGLVLWHLVTYLAGKLAKKRKASRQAPEPRSDLSEGAVGKQLSGQIKNDPERLERACAALVESLAEMYLELAESWLRKGQPQQAAAALQKIVQSCPETRQAQAARDRLRQLGAAEDHS